VQSPSNPLLEDYTEIRVFYMIGEGDISSIQCKMSIRGPKSMSKVDDPSLIFTDFYVLVSLRSVTYIQVSSAERPRHQMFAAYHIYIYIYTVQC
jgi:hypothetical protein